ncbi:N-acetyltransferase family protein [Pseudophaeobacter sp. C1-32P7]|uniref:GNAT family N-acetyltransferase n=1 Tax=Pseudophaeobacter sp. C1-32P7 TaxID=3098142 RepID=UPI0034D43AA2
MAVKVKALSGEALEAALPDLARLRIEVFRAFPYLYDGDEAYEQHYLRSYRDTPDAVLVAAISEGRVIGAATGMPLSSHGDATQISKGELPVEDVFYCAESVLLPEFRGQGIGHAFFDHREAHARTLGFRLSAFCSVIRPEDHPLRPADYRSNDLFWRKRGYRPMPGVLAEFTWTDIGDRAESKKALQFWSREL